MFPRHQRLRSPDFETIFRRGGKYAGRLMILRTTPADESHFAVVVSKKVSAKATHRNRLKRRVRAALREVAESLKTPAVVVVHTLPAAKEAELTDLQQELTVLAKQAKLL